MSDLPASAHIMEVGTRDGLQIEPRTLSTTQKLELLDALLAGGIREIEVGSFVNPKAVPQMADTAEVFAGLTRKPGVTYRALWLNPRGLERAVATPNVDLEGRLQITASEAFVKRNTNRSIEETFGEIPDWISHFKQAGVAPDSAAIMAAFGCNFEGDIPVQRVADLVQQLLDVAEENGVSLKYILLADTMAWATPQSIKRTLGFLRDKYPDLEFALHLHDTRGMGVANAFAGLEMGVTRYDSSVAGLGGCPFAGHAGAAGNVCTEDFVFMCHEMGIETGIDLEALIDCARLAEDIVGHPLPGSVMRGGSLGRLRERLSARQ
jgi:hydroxymethylglutaryl-CoA lyase